MAFSGVGSYANAYENLYVSKRNESNVSKQTKTSETDGTSAAKTETAKKSSNEEYLKSLQKQVPYIKLQTGYGLNANNDGKINVVDVNPKLLEKMQKDPEAAKEYTQRLKDIESATKWVDGWEKSMGYTAIVRHGYVDENGKFSSFAVVVRKDELNEKLRKEAQENAEKQIEKTRENARQKAEQIAEKLEEKAEEAEETEGKKAISEGTQDENNTAKNKAEKLLAEKLEQTGDGEVYLDDENMQTLIEAAKEKEAEQLVKKSVGKEVEGTNFDMKI